MKIINNKNYIDNRDFFATIIVCIAGTAIYKYVSEAAESSAQNSYLFPIFTFPIILLIAYIMYKGIEKNNFIEIDEIFINTFGKNIGIIFLLVFAISSLLTAGFEIRMLLDISHLYFYKRTNIKLIILIFVLICQYFVRGGLEVVVRFNRLVLSLIIIIYVICFLLLLTTSKFENLLPIIPFAKNVDYIGASKTSISIIIGIEILYIVMPNIKNKDNSFKIIKKSIIFETIFVISISIVTIATLSQYQLNTYLYLLNAALETVSLTNELIESWGVITQVIIVIFKAASTINIIYFVCFILSKIFKKMPIEIISSFVSPILFIIAAFDRDVLTNIYIYENILVKFQLVLYIVIPVSILMLVNKKRRKGVKV